MVPYSSAVLLCALTWLPANAYLPLGCNHAVHPPGLKSTRGAATQLQRRPARQPRAQQLLSCASGSIDSSSRSPLETRPETRGQFLGKFFLSSAAVFVCTAATESGGSKAAIASDGVASPRKDAQGKNNPTSGTSGVVRDPQRQPPPAESAASSAISGLVAGAAVSTSKQLLLYPVDTIKTRLQLPRDGRSPEMFRGLYDGVLPPLLAGLPSGALFFSAKDSISTAISNMSGGQYADLTTVAAVGLAQFPYWGIRTPAELLKIRSQAGMSSGSGAGLQGAKAILAEEGVKGLYTGYSSNVAYAFPADAIKFLVYGALKRSAKKAKGGAKLGTVEAAVLGAGASLAAQAVTTPLDVVRTRVMAASADDDGYAGGVAGALGTIGREEGFAALWAGINPRMARSLLSGAIQFGSYEFVKGLFGVEPRKL